MKPISSYTLEEAEAYRRGYADGLRAQRDPQVVASDFSEPGKSPACKSEYPDYMCGKCNCWKMMREYCS